MADTDVAPRFLDVPGARLCYEVQGTGPLLLLIGPMGSRGLAPIAPLLTEDYTVVTYDPRGMLRSTDEDPDREVTVALLADDIHRLLLALGDGPACLFGNSGACAIGLDLVARYPDQVSILVAHEPPLIQLLPGAAQICAAFEDVRDTYATAGINAALKKYSALTGVARFSRPRGDGRDVADDLDSFNPSGEVRAVLDHFFLHVLLPTTCYQPDIAALRAAPTRIVVGSGVATKTELARQATAALAGRLGLGVMDFPGDHTGFQAEPAAFARTLRQLLSGPA